MTASAADARKILDSVKHATDPKGAGYRDFLKAHARSMRSVTPDERRAPYTPADYLKAHLDPAHQGHGPVGHGYSTANLDAAPSTTSSASPTTSSASASTPPTRAATTRAPSAPPS